MTWKFVYYVYKIHTFQIWREKNSYSNSWWPMVEHIIFICECAQKWIKMTGEKFRSQIYITSKESQLFWAHVMGMTTQTCRYRVSSASEHLCDVCRAVTLCIHACSLHKRGRSLSYTSHITPSTLCCVYTHQIIGRPRLGIKSRKKGT